MSKSRINIQQTPLNPFAFEESIGSPIANNPYQAVSNGLEFVTEVPIEEGYSSLGNSRYAQQALQNYKTEQQGAMDLIAKGVGRTIAKVGTEILKTPGYVGGAAMGISNELFGDGKNSMSLMVDNSWVNAFESLDEQTKALMPVHISQEIQDGNILDKMGSGAWWATQGADGVGFMLSMFVPGAIAKLAGSGKALAGLAEVIANTKLGKITAAPKLLGLSPEVAELAGQAREGQAWINGADGIVAATVNTGLEAAAEAAGTFDNTYKGLKDKVKAGEMSDERAREIAGEKASSVFKSNLGLLMVSNLLEQAWVWKAFGSNADSVIAKATKDGIMDYNALRSQANKSFKQTAKEYGSGALKNAAKEGVFEEGLQTQIEQNIEVGKTGAVQAGYDLLGNIFGGKDEFWENTELHEAMVLGSVLGSGMGFVGQVKENNNLDRFLNGYSKAESEDKWYNKLLKKVGVKQDAPDQKGIINILEENFIKNFKGDLTSLQTDGKLDPNKMYKAWEDGKKEEYIHAMYDSAVATGDEIGRQKWGLLIAQNYTQPFLGQQGMEKVFGDHVKNELTPVWQDRFQKQNGREATQEETTQFQEDFTKSGDSVFNAYNEATRTNYPERFIKPEKGSTNQYASFRQKYFNAKLQTLLEFESLKTVKTKADEEFRRLNLESKVERLDDFGYKIKDSITAKEGQQIQDYFKLLKEVDKKQTQTNQNYESLFDKETVNALYDAVIKDDLNVEEEVAKDTSKKKEEVKTKVEAIAKKEEEIIKASEPIEPVIENGKRKESNIFDNFRDILDNEDVYKNWSNVRDYSDRSVFSDKMFEIWEYFDKLPKGVVPSQTDIDDYLSSEKLTKNKIIRQQISKLLLEKYSKSTNEPVVGTPIPSEKVKITRKPVPVKKTSTGEKKELTVTDTPEGTRIGELTDEGLIELRPEDFTDFQLIDESAQQVVEDFNPSDFQIIDDTRVDLSPTSSLPDEPLEDVSTSDLVEQEIGKLPISDKHTSGVNASYTFDGKVYKDNLTPEGLPVLGTPAQQRWFKYVDQMEITEADTIVIYPFNKIKENEELFAQISKEISGIEIFDNDLWSVLYKNGQPVKVDGQFVFTSIQRPETTYKAGNVRVANSHIDKFPGDTYAEKLRNAQSVYEQWYYGFKEPTEVSINEVTKGHMVMRYDDSGNVIWNQASTNIPSGVHQVVVSETGTVDFAGKIVNVNKGDVVAISNDINLYPLRVRNINKEEADMIVHMLSLLNNQSVDDIVLDVSIPITSVKSRNNIGVFTDTEVPLFNYFTRFSKGEGGFYVEGQIVVYHPYGQEQRTIALADLYKDSDALQDFKDFLLSKRKAFNKRLVESPAVKFTFDKGSIRSQQTNGTYLSNALENDLLTMSVVHPDYPSRLQKNLYIGWSTGKTVVQETMKSEPIKKGNKYADRNKKASGNLDADKVFTADELLQIKLQSGEITKTCK